MSFFKKTLKVRLYLLDWQVIGDTLGKTRARQRKDKLDNSGYDIQSGVIKLMA